MLRKLGIFEKAMLLANKHAPFNIVSVLRIENAPSPVVVQEALGILQARHPLLRARIIDSGREPLFEVLSSLDIPFEVTERADPDLWREVAMQEMAYRFDHTIGPLFRAHYVFEGGYGDLILNLHHAIVDAASGMNLLDELLRICAGEAGDLPVLAPVLTPEDCFPPRYKGPWKIFNTAGYAFSQLGDMINYLWRTRTKRKPPVRLGGTGRITSLTLPEELVASLSRRGRKRGLTLNSLLNAALVIAVNKHLYDCQPVTMRTFSFADLRPFTKPPTPKEHLGSFISMMGFIADISSEKDLWEVAGSLHQKIYYSLKRGDKFSALLMSETLLKMFTRMKSMRFGAVALNYNGYVPLDTQYRLMKLVGLHGFVSGYDLGPEMASQARLFNNQLWWDFIYLDTDMDDDLAAKITNEVVIILEQAAHGALQQD